jgi:alkanesulfonate monooxygenase
VAADTLGYDGVLLPTACEDPWVVASACCGGDQRLKFLVAITTCTSQPGRALTTFDRLSGEPDDQSGHGW